MKSSYKNKNRGYQQLRVWQDAIEFYVLSWRVLRALPYDLRRVASQGMASVDSVHRNIAEGYCRRSLREHLQFLNYALGSLGESVTGLAAYQRAEHLTEQDFPSLNDLAIKLENGLLKLVESLERKEMRSDWIDHLVLTESNVAYEGEAIEPTLPYSNTPSLLS